MKTMKKQMMTLAAVLMAGAAVISCSSDNEMDSPKAQAVKTYTMTIQATKGGDETRALSLSGEGDKTLNATWATTENVYVKKGDTWATGTLQPQANGATATLKGSLTDITPAAEDELTLQFPKSGDITYAGQKGTLEDIAANFDWATATATVASVEDGKITVDGNVTFVNQQAIVKFTLKNGDDALSATKLVVAVGSTEYEVNPESAASEIYVAIPGFTGQTITLTATVGSDTYTYEKSGVEFANGNYYRVAVKMTKAAPVEPVAVDMGLPSGTKWANMNLGANSPEDIGDYYAWGETEPYYSSQNPLTWKAGKEAGYDWASYTKFGTHDNSIPKESGFNKYNTTDEKFVLEAADDAATANWGNGWRMPTKEEVAELLAAYPQNSTSGSNRRAWLENYNGTGVNGLAFYNASDNILLFLPASGSFNGTTLGGNALCSYWSSTLLHGGANSEYASALVHNSTNNYSNNSFPRFQGRSIRPVK